MKTLPSCVASGVRIAFMLACTTSIVGAQQVPNADIYAVAFGHTLDSVHVEADVSCSTGKLFMEDGYRPGVRSDHVSHLVITDGGQAVPFTYDRGDSSWVIGLTGHMRLHLSYDVDLSYLQALPDWAALQYGRHYGRSLYLVTGDVFIVADSMESVTATVVSIRVPSGVGIFTPWRSSSSGGYATSAASLAGNTVILGNPSTYLFGSAGLAVTIAFIGGADRYRSDLSSIARYSLKRYARLFGSSPNTPYLLTITLGNEDGQAYDSSSAVRAAGPLVRENRVIWANGMAHELFHLWNGRTMRPVDAKLKFFVEGFTEYEANRSLLLGQFISPAEYWQMAARHLGSYIYFSYSPNYNMPLLNAGADTTKNRFGVYDGGWTLALCLDLQLRHDTHGRKTLNDVMREMWRRFGHPGATYSYDDLVQTVSAVFGRDYGPFFRQYVAGTDLLPFRADLATIGVQAYSELFDGYTFIDTAPRTAAERSALNEFMTD
jgi:predicted metalloprotease with PDZ domain